MRVRGVVRFRHAEGGSIERRARREAGFTLIELLIVLGILALLASVATPQVLRYLGTARAETAKV